MNPKLILCLAFVFSGGLFGCSRVEIPSIEYTQNYFSGQSASNLWSGRTFSKILPAQEIKHIILFDDRAFQNPFLPRTTPQEIQIQCNALFSYLEHSAQKTGGSYLADNEGTGAQFVIVTSSGGVFHVQALSRFGVGILGNTTGVLISGQGLAARIDLKDLSSSSVTNPPAVDTDPPLPPVETDYLLDQKPGDWAGRRFEQIVPVRKIKRIVLLEETTDILDYFPKEPNAPEQREHQIGYGKA